METLDTEALPPVPADHRHLARSLLAAGWVATSLFFLDLAALVLWIVGCYASLPDSLLDLDLKIMAGLSATLAVLAILNLLSRLLARITTKLKIHLLSWMLWLILASFGISCLFLALLVTRLGSGISG